MIGTSHADYIFIRLCVYFLSSIAPVGTLYSSLVVIASPLLPWDIARYRAPFAIEAWLFAEALFYLAFFLPYNYYLQREAVHPARASRHERQVLVARCLDSMKQPEAYFTAWFYGARLEDIKLDNMKEFLAWAFFNASHVDIEDEQEIYGYVRAFEDRIGQRFEPGRSNVKSLRLSLDKVNLVPRSLLWYGCIFVVDLLASCSLMWMGFSFHRLSYHRFFTVFPFRPLSIFSRRQSPAAHVTYWYRPHTAKDRLPVLFVHGIGVGLYPYCNFLREVNANSTMQGEVGIIALELMPVSSRLTHPALDSQVLVHEIHSITQAHGWDKFILVSHSYGTVVSTYLLKSPLTAPTIGPVVLIDPVSFLLHLPDVAFNFTVRQPTNANEYQLWYFGSKDIGVAHTLGRRFFWSECILWREDMLVEDEAEGPRHRDITVALSGKDLIVDTASVREYLLAPVAKDVGGDGKQMDDGANGLKREMKQMNGHIQQMNGHVEHMNGHTGRDKETEAQETNGAPWTGTGLEVIWSPELDHAQIFDSPRTRRPLIQAIQIYAAKDWGS